MWFTVRASLEWKLATKMLILSSSVKTQRENTVAWSMRESLVRLMLIGIINHTLPSTIWAVISSLTCMSMASNSTSNSECYLAVRVQVGVLLLP